MLNIHTSLLFLLSAVIAASSNDYNYYNHLPKSPVIPTHYDLHLRTELHTGAKELKGTVRIEVEVMEPTRYIVLHSLKLTLQNVSLFDATGNRLDAPEINFKLFYPEVLILSCKRELRRGKYALWFEFQTTKDYGWKVWQYDDDEDGSQKYALVSRFGQRNPWTAFPSFDNPAIKATFSLKVTHHRKLSVDSNMPLIDTPRPLDADYVVSHFEITPKISPYSLAFVVTEGFKSFGSANHSIKAHSSVINKTHDLLHLAKDLLEVLDQYTGLPYRDNMPKLTHLVIPVEKFRCGSENWGIIVHNEDSIIPSQSVSYAMAHLWFGNLITTPYYNSWLKEGFAELYTYYALDLARPSERWMEWFNVKIKPKGMDKGRYFDAIGVVRGTRYRPFRYGVFERTASILNMIRQIVGDLTWQQFVRNFLIKSQLKATVVPMDLYKEMELFTDGSEQFPNNFTIEQIMHTWMTNYRVPEISVDRQYDACTMTIRQNQTEPDLSEENYFFRRLFTELLPKQNQTWIIPYNYARESDADFDEVGPIHWLAEPSVVIPTNATSNEWILLGKRHFGLYHINYDERNWKLLAQALRTNISCMPPENRAQLLLDAFYFYEKSVLNKTVLFELLTFLSGETDSLVWFTALPVIDSFKQDRRAVKYQNYFQIFLKHLTKRYFDSILTTAATSTNDQFVRNSVTFLACQIENPDCLSAAYTKFQQAYRTNSSDLPSDDDGIHVFCFGSYQASDREFRWLLQQFKAANGDKRKLLMKYLACTKKPERLRVLIKLVNDDKENLLNELYQGLQIDLSETVTWRLVKVLQDRKFAEQIDITIIRLLLEVMNDRMQSEQAERAVLEIRNRFQDGLREIGIEDWDTYRKSELEDTNGTINKFLEGHFLTT